jgi:hypothetical protein
VKSDAAVLTKRMPTENEQSWDIDGVIKLVLTVITMHLILKTIITDNYYLKSIFGKKTKQFFPSISFL